MQMMDEDEDDDEEKDDDDDDDDDDDPTNGREWLAFTTIPISIGTELVHR